MRALLDELVPALDVWWVEEALHQAAVAALLASGAGDVSLVDWTSFELIRRLGAEQALAFDDDFAAHGFALLPPPAG